MSWEDRWDNQDDLIVMIIKWVGRKVGIIMIGWEVS